MALYQIGYIFVPIIAIVACAVGIVAAFLLMVTMVTMTASNVASRAAFLIIIAFICVWVRIGNGESLGNSKYVNNPNATYVMSILESVEGVGAVQAANSKTDTNNLLNEEKGGTAVVFFEFESVNQEQFKDGQNVIEKGTDAGGCIEVFENAKKMKKRARHLFLFPLMTGRYKTVGTVIVRISTKLSWDEQSALAAEICERLLNNDTSDNIEVSYNSFAFQKKIAVILFCLIAVGVAFCFVRIRKESSSKESDEQSATTMPSETLPASTPHKVVTLPETYNVWQNAESLPHSPLSFSDIYNGDLFPIAVDIALETGQASVSMLQRRLKIGYSQASRLVDQMEQRGYVGPFEGSAPRRVLIDRERWEKIRNTVHDEPLERKATPPIDIEQIIRDEENWRRERLGLSPIEYELQKVDSMAGHAFEEWCADLLRRNGFSSVEVTPGSGDQGVDVIAEKDGLKYAVQCKRYSSDLGNTPVQEVVAGKAFYHCHIGAVMTNSHFTNSAKELAEVNGILLWDRDVIINMLKTENPDLGIKSGE